MMCAARLPCPRRKRESLCCSRLKSFCSSSKSWSAEVLANSQRPETGQQCPECLQASLGKVTRCVRPRPCPKKSNPEPADDFCFSARCDTTLIRQFSPQLKVNLPRAGDEFFRRQCSAAKTKVRLPF